MCDVSVECCEWDVVNAVLVSAGSFPGTGFYCINKIIFLWLG